jgi:hypothetical protein
MSETEGDDHPRYRVVCSEELPFTRQVSGLPDRSLRDYILYKLLFITEHPKIYSFNISYNSEEYWVYIGDRVSIYYFLVGEIVVPFYVRRR